jgi:hypothetical protein
LSGLQAHLNPYSCSLPDIQNSTRAWHLADNHPPQAAGLQLVYSLCFS